MQTAREYLRILFLWNEFPLEIVQNILMVMNLKPAKSVQGFCSVYRQL